MSDDQWKALMDMWSSPKHKENCLKAKLSREKLQYHHKTGSRCYIAQTYVVKKDKYKDAEPTAIDLFRDLHCSSKTGISEPVREAIEQMEAIMTEPTDEGQDPKTPAEAVAQVLPSSKFLKNIGLDTRGLKKTTTAADAARIQELEAEVQAEREDGAALRNQIEYQRNQLDGLNSKIEECEVAKQKQQEELEILKKTCEETNGLLRRLLGLNRE